MARVLAGKLARLLLAIWLAVSLAFLLVYALPGDTARLILGQRASAETLEQFRSASGLDQPLASQYVTFIERAAHWDFGESLSQRRAVGDLILERAPQTIKLAFVALTLVFLFAFLMPLLVALFQPIHRLHWLSGLCGAFAAMPPYVLAVAILLFFGSWLGWVPVLFDPQRLTSWLLPALVLAAYPIAIVVKLFSQQIEIIFRQPYVLRAKAYGFSARTILLTEILPNALTPALGALANNLAIFVTGSFFVEVVFGITGLGGLTYEAIRNRDLPLLMGICITYAVFITMISALLEAALLAANPKMRLRHE